MVGLAETNDPMESLWRECLAKMGLDPGDALQQSRYDRCRRSYAKCGNVYKLALLSPANPRDVCAQDLSGEFALLRELRDVKGIPVALDHSCWRGIEVLRLERVEGRPLTQIRAGWLRMGRVWGRVAVILWNVARRGISHNDISEENILVSSGDRVTLIDFDQATRTPFAVALLRDFLGAEIGPGPVRGSLWRTVGQFRRRRSRLTSAGKGVILGSIRALVVRSRHLRLCRAAYQCTYDLALHVVRASLSREPGVLALVLRGRSPGGWEPGLSDFDITVIMAEASLEERLRFLSRVWGKYFTLRRWIPMLVEVDLLTLSEFEDATALACAPNQSSKRYGQLWCPPGPMRNRLHSVLDAANRVSAETPPLRDVLVRYHYFALPRYLSQQVGSDSVDAAVLRHNLAKLDALCGGRREPSSIGSLLRRMTQICDSHAPASDPGASFDPEAQRLAAASERDLDLLADQPHVSAVQWEPIHGEDRIALAFLLDDDISERDAERIARLLGKRTEALAPGLRSRLVSDPLHFGLSPGHPHLMTRSMWRRWMDLFPLEAAAVVAAGRRDVATWPGRRSLAEFAALQYGVWLICRNDWVKEPAAIRSRSFCSMVATAELLCVALRTGSLPHAAFASPGAGGVDSAGGMGRRAEEAIDDLPLKQAYQLSTRALKRLRAALDAHRDERAFG